MGVNVFLLDRKPVRLSVAGVAQNVGSLRRFWKITELDGERAAELNASQRVSSGALSPKAAMLADISELPLGSPNAVSVKAHLVIGWDEGRTRVTDFYWDYLPTLGYAVRDPDSGMFVLHEERDNALYRLGRERAVELGLIGANGLLLSRGQPVIKECRAVRPFVPGYAQADCVFDNGREQNLMVGVAEGQLPEPDWFVGRKPMEAEYYPSARPSALG